MTTKNIYRAVKNDRYFATLFFAVEDKDMESFRTFADSKNLFLDGFSEPFSGDLAAAYYRRGDLVRHYAV